MKTIRIAVTGGRNFSDKDLVWRVLDRNKTNVEAAGATMFLVVGDARGVDYFARKWAEDRGVEHKVFVAKWKDAEGNYNPAAGPIRNRDMLISGIDKLCAFPGGAGTADMTRICRNTKVYVVEYK